MPGKAYLLEAFLILLCAAAGCNGKTNLLSLKANQEQTRIVVPPHVEGTVAEFATMVGGDNVPVQAHGLVVGLGENGSSEVPANIFRAMVEYLSKQDLGSYRMGTAALTPERVLTDKDTAVVLVGGAVEMGAPVGTKFDLYVSALPQTQTKSLDGGMLMPIDLALAYGGVSNPELTTRVWANGAGPVFINPFVDTTSPDQAAKLLAGRIIGGGTVTRHQPIRLQLHRPDYQVADQMQRQIHTRFDPGEKLLLSQVVKGRSRSLVDVTIPKAYHDDYLHFLQLVMHLPIRYGQGGWEGYARRIAEQMEQPAANHDELALVLEAMGRQTLPLVQKLYTSSTPAASFYAARTGLRLGDVIAAEVLLRFADSAESPQQLPAVEELGRRPDIIRAAPILRRLLDDSNEQVRLTAYRALLARGDTTVITTIDLPDQFKIDVVKTSRDYAIYATQTMDTRIVLFGQDLAVIHPVYFEAPGELVTVNAFGNSDKLTVFRSVPAVGRKSDPVEVGLAVRDLVEALGRIPEPDENGKVKSLGLSYSQVVGVLYRMSQAGDIPARFVLQPTEDIQRIYQGGAVMGRPDMPAE